ncbi:MAG: hypothetical protein ABW360_04570 [Phenylobacterium sp.]
MRTTLILLASLSLGACAATKLDDLAGYSTVVYPHDFQQGYSEAPVRWAEPGDVVWLRAQERRYWDLDGGVITARDPHTGQTVSRTIRHWRSFSEGGGARYYAPEAYFYSGQYKATSPVGNPVFVQVGQEPPDMPPPYACVKDEEYSRANLTWTLGRCAPGRRNGQFQQSHRADLRDWTEASIRLLGVEAGQARFVYRERRGWKGRDANGVFNPTAPQSQDQEFTLKVGAGGVPEAVRSDVDIGVTAIAGQRVAYRLARRVYPCRDPRGCVEE